MLLTIFNGVTEIIPNVSVKYYYSLQQTLKGTIGVPKHNYRMFGIKHYNLMNEQRLYSEPKYDQLRRTRSLE
jgi:hypothetical protein